MARSVSVPLFLPLFILLGALGVQAEERPLPSWSDTALATSPRRLPRVRMNEYSFTVAPREVWSLPLGSATRGVLEIRSSRPVDVFVARLDQGQAVRAAAAGDTAAAPQVLELRPYVTATAFDWIAPDRRIHNLYIENGPYPAGGASSGAPAEGRVITYGLVPPPGDPVPGRSLLLGRFRVAVRDSAGRESEFPGPRRLRVRHVARDGSEARPLVTVLESDDSGFFYFSNVPPDRAWWIEGVEGPGFVVIFPETGMTSRRRPWPASAALHETSWPGVPCVADLGSFFAVVETATNRLVRAELRREGDRYQVASSGRWQSSRIRTEPRTRHAWFLDYFGDRSWSEAVRAHLQRLERGRRSPVSSPRAASSSRAAPPRRTR